MNMKEIENGQIAANWAQLTNDKASFIVPANKYDVRYDERLLIPIVVHHKVGFVNRWFGYVVAPKYDIYYGDIFSPEDFVKVGVRYSYGFQQDNGEIQTYDRYKWGLIDVKGEVILEPKYISVKVSDTKKLLIVHDRELGYSVIDRQGNTIVPYGTYDLIDAFTNGYARVKIGRRTNGIINSGNKWGIINEIGEVVLPLEYDDIWSFEHKPELRSTHILKIGEPGKRFWFSSGNTDNPIPDFI